jgi:hypothetical protein
MRLKKMVGSSCPCLFFLNPYLIAMGRKVQKLKAVYVPVMEQNGYLTSTSFNRATSIFPLPNSVKMVKKRVRDAEVLPEASVQASIQDDDSGSDEVISRLTPHSPLLTGNTLGH